MSTQKSKNRLRSLPPLTPTPISKHDSYDPFEDIADFFGDCSIDSKSENVFSGDTARRGSVSQGNVKINGKTGKLNSKNPVMDSSKKNSISLCNSDEEEESFGRQQMRDTLTHNRPSIYPSLRALITPSRDSSSQAFTTTRGSSSRALPTSSRDSSSQAFTTTRGSSSRALPTSSEDSEDEPESKSEPESESESESESETESKNVKSDRQIFVEWCRDKTHGYLKKLGITIKEAELPSFAKDCNTYTQLQLFNKMRTIEHIYRIFFGTRKLYTFELLQRKSSEIYDEIFVEKSESFMNCVERMVEATSEVSKRDLGKNVIIRLVTILTIGYLQQD